MALRIDLEGNELVALKQSTDWRQKQVLEIGCGSGRLTRRLARLGANVHAIDPLPELINTARQELPRSFSARVHFDVGKSSRLPFAEARFDVAVFAWSL